MTTGLAKDVAKDGIRLNCLAPGWIASDGPRQYWESLTPGEREERGVPSKLLSTEDIAGMVGLTLAGKLRPEFIRAASGDGVLPSLVGIVVPERARTTSERPTGTDSCGMLGTPVSSSRNSCSAASACASSAEISSPNARTCF